MLLGSTKNKLAALLAEKQHWDLSRNALTPTRWGAPPCWASQPIIKAHGSSNAYAFFNAIRQAQWWLQADIVGDISRQRGPRDAPGTRGKKEGYFSNLLLTEPEIVPILSTASPVKWIPKRSSSI